MEQNYQFKQEIKDELVTFCTGCFATNKDGSWATNGWSVDALTEKNNYCMNCGSGGRLIIMNNYSAKDIRKNASWVGKRFYPDKEDLLINKMGGKDYENL